MFGCWVKSVRIGFFHTSHSNTYFVNALRFNSKAVVERRGFRPKIFDDRIQYSGVRRLFLFILPTSPHPHIPTPLLNRI
ncbi:MAG: hypothetical protein EWV44_05975 [Microcystis flos-aquae Mf_QC_C_20070823_S20T]|nr:MAG: hypothetical protein EWV44_05975 [Microcystis flos-aquae Mf_QC_C_20070823_S20T]